MGVLTGDIRRYVHPIIRPPRRSCCYPVAHWITRSPGRDPRPSAIPARILRLTRHAQPTHTNPHKTPEAEPATGKGRAGPKDVQGRETCGAQRRPGPRDVQAQKTCRALNVQSQKTWGPRKALDFTVCRPSDPCQRSIPQPDRPSTGPTLNRAGRQRARAGGQARLRRRRSRDQCA